MAAWIRARTGALPRELPAIPAGDRRFINHVYSMLLRSTQGRAASQRLIAAWTKMTQRYPEWSREMQDSIYHHLCALDLF